MFKSRYVHSIDVDLQTQMEDADGTVIDTEVNVKADVCQYEGEIIDVGVTYPEDVSDYVTRQLKKKEAKGDYTQELYDRDLHKQE